MKKVKINYDLFNDKPYMVLTVSKNSNESGFNKVGKKYNERGILSRIYSILIEEDIRGIVFDSSIPEDKKEIINKHINDIMMSKLEKISLEGT